MSAVLYCSLCPACLHKYKHDLILQFCYCHTMKWETSTNISNVWDSWHVWNTWSTQNQHELTMITENHALWLSSACHSLRVLNSYVYKSEVQMRTQSFPYISLAVQVIASHADQLQQLMVQFHDSGYPGAFDDLKRCHTCVKDSVPDAWVIIFAKEKIFHLGSKWVRWLGVGPTVDSTSLDVMGCGRGWAMDSSAAKFMFKVNCWRNVQKYPNDI